MNLTEIRESQSCTRARAIVVLYNSKAVVPVCLCVCVPGETLNMLSVFWCLFVASKEQWHEHG